MNLSTQAMAHAGAKVVGVRSHAPTAKLDDEVAKLRAQLAQKEAELTEVRAQLAAKPTVVAAPGVSVEAPKVTVSPQIHLPPPPTELVFKHEYDKHGDIVETRVKIS